MSPRQVLHYAGMLTRIRAEELLEDLNVNTVAARGNEKAVKALQDSAAKAAKRGRDHDPERIVRPAKRSEAAATEAALKAAGII